MLLGRSSQILDGMDELAEVQLCHAATARSHRAGQRRQRVRHCLLCVGQPELAREVDELVQPDAA